MRRNNSGLFLDDIDKNQETKRNFIFAGGIHSHNLIARKSDTRCSISFLPVFLFELLLFLPLPKKKAVTRCKLGISFIKQQILFATFLYTTYMQARTVLRSVYYDTGDKYPRNHFGFINLWRRNYFFFSFSTPCIQNVNNTGTKQVSIMKQTAF